MAIPASSWLTLPLLGAGLTLHAARFAVYESFSNQAAHYLQKSPPYHRRGYTREVEYFVLLADNTIEPSEFLWPCSEGAERARPAGRCGARGDHAPTFPGSATGQPVQHRGSVVSAILAQGGGPSPVHEERAAILSAMASLTGFVHPMTGLPDGSIPDVLQLRSSDGGLFIGDAKATETAGNRETFRRLSSYADFLARWVSAGGDGVFALAVDARSANGWLQLLRDICLRPARGVRVAGRLDMIDVDTAVVWQGFAGRRTTQVD